MTGLDVGFLIGPTASGKTALSIAAAMAMDAEIVSADSIQVYRGMDIGSAKPTVAERQGIVHHLLDVVDIGTPQFSVAAYQRLAADAINAIAARGKYPLVVGGTGLYIHALTYPLRFGDVPSDEGLRLRLAAQESADPGSLHRALQAVDPQSAKRLHPNDTKRLVRALEVYTLTGKTLSALGADFSNQAGAEIPYPPHMVGLTMPRELLYRRIDERVDGMLQDGLLAEVEALLSKGALPDMPAMQGLGYKQLILYLQGHYSFEEAVEAIKRETRRFAKRQITWFKRDARIRWLDVSALSSTELLQEACKVFKERGEGHE